jgi:hypothetical protein
MKIAASMGFDGQWVNMKSKIGINLNNLCWNRDYLWYQKESKHCQMNMFPNESTSSQICFTNGSSPVMEGISFRFSSQGIHKPGLTFDFM